MSKILIVDDDDLLRKIYGHYLISEGFCVLQASSGEQALLNFAKEKVEVVLLDIGMPLASGATLITAFRRLYPGVKIVIFSCHTCEVQKEMITTADDYFDKSEGCRVLMPKIRQFISSTLTV